MAIRILTDTTSNISIEEAKKLNIELLPISINFGDDSFEDQYEITTEEFYEKLVSSESFPKTNQLSPAKILGVFSSAKENNDEIITLFLSNRLSGSYSTACFMKQEVEYDKIYNIDTLNTIVGLRILVLEACKLRDEGKTSSEIIEHVNSLVPKIKTYAIIDTLEYLSKGGRLSRTAMFVGELLKMKPIITIENGKVEVKSKTRGTIKACSKIKEYIIEQPIDTNYPVGFIYSMNDEQLNKLITNITSDLGITDYSTFNMAGSVGAHIGPNGAGIVYVSK